MNTYSSDSHPSSSSDASRGPAPRGPAGISVPAANPSTATTPASRDADTRLPGGERALVLGGGGSTGNAWLLGVLAGLLDGGVDVTRPDLTIGTSAGATATAQLAWAEPAELYAAAATPLPGPPAGRSPTDRTTGPLDGGGALLDQPADPSPPSAEPDAAPSTPSGRNRPTRDHRPQSPAPQGNCRVNRASAMMERTSRLIAESADLPEYRRRLGAAARDLLEDNPSWPERWRGTVAARLPRAQWPEHRLLLTAVDAVSGEPVCFDNHSGVELIDAVAASCASGLPYPIDEVPYLDGGYRRNENADLAAGHRRVLVLSPFGGRSRTPAAWGQQLAAQVDELRGAGSRVETIFPDRDLTGATAMDLSLRPAAADLGHRQGVGVAARIGEFWS